MMPNAFHVCKNGLRAHFAGVIIIRLMFLTACWNCGKAGVVVYEEDIDIEEFPDVELSYTHPIRRNGIEGPIVAAHPSNACVSISKPPDLNISLDWFVLISGNSCSFETKVLNAKSAGYSVAVIYTYRGKVEGSSNRHSGHYRFFSNISAIVIRTEHGLRIKDNYLYTIDDRFRVFVFPNNSFGIMTFLLLFSIVAGLFLVVMLAFAVIKFFQQTQSTQNGRLSSRHLKQLETSIFQKGDPYETCAICLEDYKDQDRLRILPCSHGYHVKCIDPWLTNSRPICPVCKQKVVLVGHNPADSTIDSDSDERPETTPLLQTSRVSQHGTFDTPVVRNFNPLLHDASAENEHSFSSTGGRNASSFMHL